MNANVTYDDDSRPINYPVNTSGTLQTLVHDQEDRMTNTPNAFSMAAFLTAYGVVGGSVSREADKQKKSCLMILADL